MADILPFKRKPAIRRSALCANGHHRWVAVKASPFDVKQGKLITRFRCEKCGTERIESR